MPYREDRKWRACVTHKGQRHQGLFQSKKDALEWEAAKRRELKKSDKSSRRGMALIVFCGKYLDFARRFSAKTYKEKRALCGRILKAWGPDILAVNVTSEMVLAYLDNQAETRSSNASNKDRKNLMALWSWGVAFLELPSNPVLKTKKRPHDRKPQYAPPQDDVLKVLAVATREERVFLDCYLQTGARRSEIFRWNWLEDINLEYRQVRLGTRKNRDGSMDYQWLPMSESLFESLSWWWGNRPVKTSPFVFVNPKGEQYSTRRRFMAGLCKRAGVRPFGFHALRRYVASILADTHKVSAKTIQRILRHKQVATTERYIHHLNSDLQNTMNMLSEKKIPEGHTRSGGI